MLVCAVLVSLAFGVLAAYGLCLGFFRLMQIQADAIRTPAVETKAVEAVSKL
jgi:ABC-type spermidine/putrescine transport system permease subunit II